MPNAGSRRVVLKSLAYMELKAQHEVVLLLATWGKTRRVVHVVGSMELKMATLGGCSML